MNFSKTTKHIIFGMILLIPLLFSAHVVQAVSYDAANATTTDSNYISPGHVSVSTCGSLLTTGTYTLSVNLTNISGPCFIVLANDVIIDGNYLGSNHTVTASGSNTSYAIVATSSIADGGSAFGTTTIQNIIFTNFLGGGINAKGNESVYSYPGVTNGGSGGSVIIATSTIGTTVTGAITVNAASYGNINGGAGGTVTITNSTTGPITASGGYGNYGGVTGGGLAGTAGTINITTSTTGTIISNGGTAYGEPGTNHPGASGGTINVSSTSTTGAITSNGGQGGRIGVGGTGGAISVSSNSTTGPITASGGGGGSGYLGVASDGGPGGTINVSYSITGAILVTGGAAMGQDNFGGNGGVAGTINITNSTSTTLTATGGAGGGSGVLGGVGGAGGTINITTATTTIITSNGGTGGSSGGTVGTSGPGGAINISANSSTGAVTAQGANGGSGKNGNGGAGGNITVSTNSATGALTSVGGAAAPNDIAAGFGGAAGVITVSGSTVTTVASTGGAGGGSAGTGGYGGAAGAITISSATTTGAISSTGGQGASAGANGGAGGIGGAITVATSTVTTVSSTGGVGGRGATSVGIAGAAGAITVATSTTANVTASGANGSIAITGTNLNLSNNTYTASSTLSLTYSGTLTTTNTTLSALAHLIIDSGAGLPGDLGSYVGGSFPLFPGIINSCGTLYFAGTYTFGGDITGNCNINVVGITLSGAGHTLTGNVTANNYGTTFSSTTVIGAVSTTGNGAGTITLNVTSSITGAVSVTGPIAGDLSGSITGVTTINSGGSVATSSVSFVGDVINNGTIDGGNSVSGKTTNDGTINGNFAFNASSTNSGTVNGNATLNASSTNIGTITGTARFNMFTAASSVVSFSSTTAFIGTGYVSGNVLDSAGTTITSWIFNDSSTNAGYLKGNAVFNNTSSNTITGTVTGSARFDNTSTNLGRIKGNADVYSPVVKPLGGIVEGLITYHEYPGFYYNNATGDGKWDTLGNWWSDAAFSVPALSIPTATDDVYIYGPINTNSGSPASVQTATYYGGSSNGIAITASHGVTFTSTSTNAALGSVLGAATFIGDEANDLGSIVGTVVRRYLSSVSTVRNFITEGGHTDWIVEAYNAVVDLSGATYSLVSNIFKAFANSVFIMNPSISGGAAVSPDVSIVSPLGATNVVKWAPAVTWGGSTDCEYKMDTGDYAPLDCAATGSDISRPTGGSHTLSVKGTDSLGNFSERSVTFTYDNTSPVYTSCGADLLDEPTRQYYYLQDNVTGNCTATIDNVDLRGALSTSTVAYTVNGNVIADGLTSGANGFNITLKYIAVTGTVSAKGATGSGTDDGGNGGIITIATSTTSTVSASGGDSAKNGGSGGAINITNSYATASSTQLVSNGGNSTNCGYGGSGGDISIVDSSDYVPVNAAGADHSCSTLPSGSPGHTGGVQTTGSYTPFNPSSPGSDSDVSPESPTSPTAIGPSGSNTGSAHASLFNFNDGGDNSLVIPVADIGPLPPNISVNGNGSGGSAQNIAGIAISALQTPAGSALVNYVSTVGAVAGVSAWTLSSLFASPLVAGEVLFVPLRLWGLLLSALGLRRRNRPWGTVYDSVTKMPLDPAVVTLSDQAGKKVGTSITDLDGRFGFFVPKGIYYLSVQKTNYTFPSQKLSQKTSDELYSDLYFGEKIEVAEDGSVIYKNIPMDQKNFDWNEFTKNKMGVMKFHSLSERFNNKLGNIIFWIGFFVGLVSVILVPHTYSIVIFSFYIILIALRFAGVHHKAFGTITDGTNHPLSFATVTIFSKDLQRDLFKKVADQYGRYYALVPKGEYEIKVSRKNIDESYTPVYESEVNAKNGVINGPIVVQGASIQGAPSLAS